MTDTDHEDMSREELLVRLDNWRTVANERSTEIGRLEQQRGILDTVLRQTIGERDRLTAGVEELRRSHDAIAADGPRPALQALRDRDEAIQRLISLLDEASPVQRILADYARDLQEGLDALLEIYVEMGGTREGLRAVLSERKHPIAVIATLDESFERGH